MKRYTQLGLIILLLALMAIVPVTAAATAGGADIATSVKMATGGGSPPVVMAKWETEPGDPSLESGDPTHMISGSQFLPPGTFEGNKMINYYAVVTDEEDNGNVLGVYADVYHPDGTFKYQIHYTQMSKSDGLAAYNAALAAGLITTPCSCTDNSVKSAVVSTCGDPLFELNKGTASVWMGQAQISYCQMDGNYLVKVRAVDQSQNPSEFLDNTFYYEPLTAAEYDFNAVDYGSVSMGPNLPATWRAGDTNFVTGDGKPTIRNVGNTRAQIKINQNDMGFGQDVNGIWNVQFDARLGHVSEEPLYNPFTDHTLIDILDRSHTDELDFSIHVIKGFDAAKGTMTLSVLDPDTPKGPESACVSG